MTARGHTRNYTILTDAIPHPEADGAGRGFSNRPAVCRPSGGSCRPNAVPAGVGVKEPADLTPILSALTTVQRQQNKLLALIALLLSICAIVLMTNTSAHGQIIGVILAVGSGCSYAFYILYLERTPLKEIPIWTFAFWSSLGCLLASAVLGVSTRSLDLSDATATGVSLILVMVPLQSVLAVRFFQLGVRYVGSTAASLLSTMEPVTSMLLGIVLLHEATDIKKLIGCGAIILSVLLVVLGAKRAQSREGTIG